MSAARLWLRNEVFDGVLPLRATGVPLSPARNTGPGGVGGPSPLFVLLKAVKEVNPHTVRWVGVWCMALIFCFCEPSLSRMPHDDTYAWSTCCLEVRYRPAINTPENRTRLTFLFIRPWPSHVVRDIEVCVGLTTEPGNFLNFLQNLSLSSFKVAFLIAGR